VADNETYCEAYTEESALFRIYIPEFAASYAINLVNAIDWVTDKTDCHVTDLVLVTDDTGVTEANNERFVENAFTLTI